MCIDISVVIPCLNEKDTIAEVISAVASELGNNHFAYEIIVVDNGSTDGSDSIAKKRNAAVLSSSSRTVAGVRNTGVDVAKGKFLVFLDADVVVQPSWGKTLRDAYQDLIKFPNKITGSNCSVPGNINPLLASWYQGISTDTRDTHLGTGHMIVTAEIFRRLGGFNKDLVTGEDYDFCVRAKKIGVSVVNNPRLLACHLGYPADLLSFARREIWHGLGDCRSFRAIADSRIALCGILFLLINIAMCLYLFINMNIFVMLLSILIAISISVNYIKFGFGNCSSFVKRIIVSYIYLFCRGLSFPYYMYMKHRDINQAFLVL